MCKECVDFSHRCHRCGPRDRAPASKAGSRAGMMFRYSHSWVTVKTFHNSSSDKRKNTKRKEKTTVISLKLHQPLVLNTSSFTSFHLPVVTSPSHPWESSQLRHPMLLSSPAVRNGWLCPPTSARAMKDIPSGCTQTQYQPH